MADTNPSNFANLPKERVQEIASLGGKASHGKDTNGTSDDDHAKKLEAEGRNPDGTFVKGSDAASDAGHVGGLHSHGKKTEEEKNETGRREDGTFLPNSEAAKEAGAKGGHAAAANN